MREVIYGDDARYIEWAAQRIGTAFRADAKAIGLARSDDVGEPGGDRDSAGRLIVASVVFDGFSECDCNMHVASDGSRQWLNREYLVRCFAFPFIQCGLRRVTGLVPAKNTAALRFDTHLGFRLEGRCRDALPDDDVIVLGMVRADCRFIPKEHRQ
ncbi:N-acetyltransferase [Bradyrhizobium elkanii]|uniref:N-acetyltransferase n=1 Tax=Bradyrhizobium elkanii TaxID=29448 RepID=UPI003518CE50